MNDPYCGGCHQWMTELFPNVWVCDCTVSGHSADTSKDPQCKNPSHDHHDPQSPVVLSHHAIRDAEEEAEEAAFDTRQLADFQPVSEVEVDEEARRELDEILEETNRQFETEYEMDVLCICDGPQSQPCGDNCEYPYADGMPFEHRHQPPTPAEVIYIEEAYRRKHIVHTGSPCEDCGALITDEQHSEEEYKRAGGILAGSPVEERDQCLLYGCVWVRIGIAYLPPIMEWGPVHCMRCNRLAPDDIPTEPIIDQFLKVVREEDANTKADPRILAAELEVASLKAFAEHSEQVWGHIVGNSCQEILDILGGKDGLVQQPPQNCPHCNGPL